MSSVIPYGNKSGNSDVRYYDFGEGFIIVQFRKALCRYSEAKNDSSLIDEMKAAAKAGYGLTALIGKRNPQEDWHKEL